MDIKPLFIGLIPDSTFPTLTEKGWITTHSQDLFQSFKYFNWMTRLLHLVRHLMHVGDSLTTKLRQKTAAC